jgi:hypothetical protein
MGLGPRLGAGTIRDPQILCAQELPSAGHIARSTVVESVSRSQYCNYSRPCSRLTSVPKVMVIAGKVVCDRPVPPWPRPNSHVTSRHFEADRATFYISPGGCPGRVHRNPAKSQGLATRLFTKNAFCKEWLMPGEPSNSPEFRPVASKWRLMTRLLGLPHHAKEPMHRDLELSTFAPRSGKSLPLQRERLRYACHFPWHRNTNVDT